MNYRHEFRLLRLSEQEKVLSETYNVGGSNSYGYGDSAYLPSPYTMRPSLIPLKLQPS